MWAYEPPREGDLEEVKIEVTRDCPLACLHCSSNASPGNGLHLSRDLVLSLVRQAAEMGVKSIVLSGGEPLVWPWIHDAVSACAAHGLNCSLYSTGIVHNGDGAQAILGLGQLGLRSVVFSLYSSRKEYHEQITRKACSFDRTMSVISETKHSSLRREIHVVPLKRNYKQLGELVKLAAEGGVSKVSILRFVPHGRGAMFKGSREMLMEEETEELRRLIIECRQNGEVTVRVGSPYNILVLEKDVACNAARQTLVIGPNGNLYPCDAFKNIEPSDLGVGDTFNNILAYRLRECWERSEYLNAIRSYLSTPFGKPCSTCRYLEWCKSGCLAQKVIEQESLLASNIATRADPLCLKKFIGG